MGDNRDTLYVASLIQSQVKRKASEGSLRTFNITQCNSNPLTLVAVLLMVSNMNITLWNI